MDEIINETESKPPQYYADFDDFGNIVAFYVDEIHGDSIPDTAIPITYGEWQMYLTDTSRYKLDGDTIREKTQEEIDEEIANRPPSPPRKPTETEILGEQLFDTQTELIQTKKENETLGRQLFDLQTDLMLKGVL
ncbi:hypothetical protein [Paenibacillus sp. J2TS4]|uniref:hypothetical protein n=1 Tax=Paenibacillus sp. J2TS4 TaxID=2807194 RepID=UPI001AFCE917|nr:hypothetical protein [Paenibacillus sp. J2TS4]GIP35517.1 hypothetical protein J2TS4_47270 [Paenibacillus sp. J2TS4]